MANELQTQLDRLNNQARFVKMIVDKELVVSNRKKADIVAELRKKQFRPFPTASKAKAAGETEDVVEDEDAESEGELSDYDYLLGMAIWSLTKEKVGYPSHDGSATLAQTRAFRSRSYSNKPRGRRLSFSRSSSSRLSRSGRLTSTSS